MEVIMMPFLLGVLIFSTKGRYVPASALVGLAAGTRFWPAILIIIVLRPLIRNIKQLVPAALVFAVLFLFSLYPFYLTGLDPESGLTAYRRGYGSACPAGIHSLGKADIVGFLDGDLSDYPEEVHRFVDPIIQGRADLVIGSRILGKKEKGALTPQARFGNWLSCLLIRLFWGFSFTDLGPFRAISHPSLMKLNMAEPDYGWTVEMQVKAVQNQLRILEVPVNYRRRLGKSKISGTLRGVILAGTKILFTIFRLSILSRPSK